MSVPLRLCLALVALPLFAACSASDAPADAPVVGVSDSAGEADRLATDATPVGERPTMTVYKSATCGCCALWVEHMEGEGFDVETQDVTDLTAVKDSLGIPRAAGSCHTGVVDGYVVEGHVPAAQVRRLLRDRPDALGLAVPGMPLGSPGMEQGDVRQPYDILLLTREGAASVFDHIEGNTL